MPICPSLTNITKDTCLNNIGGLKLTAYVFPTDTRDGLSYDDSTWTVNAVEYTNGTAVLPISIEFHKNTATFVQSAAGTIETQNSTNTVTVSITVNNKSYLKSKAINVLAAGQREIDLVIQLNNHTNWFVPNAILTQTDTNSGAAKTDGSNYVLTFTAELDTLAYGIEASDFDTLISTGLIAGS